MGILDGLFGSSQQTTTTRPQVLEGLEPLVPQLVNRATAAGSRPYAMRNFARLAPMSASTRGGIGMMRGAATDPRYGKQMNAAEGMIGSSTDDANMQALIASLSRNIRPERTKGSAWTDPGTSSAYMNPYQDQVLDRLLRREDERTGERRADLDRRMAGKKAFGSGSDVATAQFERDEENRKADLIADQLNKGYESGANIYRSDADRESARAKSDADRALEAQRVMTSGIGAGATAESSRLAGRRAAGNDLSSLADRYRTGISENAKNLLGIGNIEQQDLQRGMDLQEKDFEEQRDYPENRSDFLARTIYGAPRGSTTTTPGPSVGSQLLGAGLSVAGIGGPSGFGWWGLKKGGAVRMAGGGDPLADLSDAQLEMAASDPRLPPDMRERARKMRSGRMDAPRAPQGFEAMPLPPPGAGGDAGIGDSDAMPMPPIGGGGDTGIGVPPPSQTLRPGADGVYSPADADFPLPPPGPAATGGDRAPLPLPGPGADETSGGDEGGKPDRYSAILEKLLDSQRPDKGMLLMRIGAAMMAGQKPGFLANVGEGLQAGAKGMEDDKARNLRSLGLAATIEERRQANTERAADRKEREATRRQQSQDLKDYREALLGKGKWTVGGTDPDGNVILVDGTNGETKTVKGMKPKQTGTGAQGTADTRWIDYAIKNGMVEDTPDGRTKALEMKRQYEKPADRPKLITRVYESLRSDIMDRRSDAEKQAAAKAYVDSLFEGGGNPHVGSPPPPPAQGAPAAAPAAAAPAQGAPLPMPKTQAELKKGATYATARGPAVWNGRAFEAVAAPAQ